MMLPPNTLDEGALSAPAECRSSFRRGNATAVSCCDMVYAARGAWAISVLRIVLGKNAEKLLTASEQVL